MAVDELSDPDGPLWFAATIDNRIPDVWGSLYLVSLNLSTPARRSTAMSVIQSQPTLYIRAGQVRSTPYPMTWTRCFGGCAANGTYQNGAYWATPLHYLATAMKTTGHLQFATSVLSDAVADFKANGIYEDVDYGYPASSRGVLNYTDSVTNTLLATQILLSA